jgi:nucleotide-binding universal stress UspA family protein
MEDERATGPVLVAVENPDHVQQLVRTAGDLARLGSGVVRLVTVVTKPRDSPFSIFEDETIRREFAADSHALLERATTPPDVTLEREILVARSPARGLLSAVEEAEPTGLVVGWTEGRRRADAVLGTTVDALVERAPCDLYVERVGREADGVGSVLLPVAGGPNVRVAATAATVIAVRNDAEVLVLSVATDEVTPDDASRYVEEARDAVRDVSDGDVPVDTRVRDAENATDAVVAEAEGHDVVVLGATRQSAFRRRLVGSVPRRVVRRTDRTVIVARDGETVHGPLARLGSLLRW